MFKILKKILLVIIILIVLIIAFYTFKGYTMFNDAINKMPIEDMVEQIKQKDNYTKLNDVPQIYKDAVVAVEDHRFYDHRGVDYFAVIGALINDISNQKLIQGGSTISQQICKNIYFTQERVLERKIAEIYMAVEMEKLLTKDEILELYINTCFYGNNCYTLKEASNLYYNKEPNELNDYEAVLIAGIPNAPSLYNPIHSEELAKQRMKQVLYAMVKYDFITEERKEEILKLGE